ncbi:unnamed protein product [Hyaloperonospora brassicae]|uniref:Nep1-like protein n=1 Tax=Hyaloperonospora brassicae TaxID=162125 RepID=A0AAV0TLF0_HYABA|nr:unnamed protein product [Hyaloperonospora brassicae]
MKTGLFVYTALFAATVVQAHDASHDVVKNVSPDSNPESNPDVVKRMLKSIKHKDVMPFPQPKPITVSEIAGVKFKPELHITDGCASYPFVNAAGEISGGLDNTGSPNGMCKGSGYGSQVYGRSDWYNNKWAIMFVYYFPKDSPSSLIGRRHGFEQAIVWLENPATSNVVMAVSLSEGHEFSKTVGPDSKFLNGTSVKLSYEKLGGKGTHGLKLTETPGDSLPLIMWEQLTPEARDAVNAFESDGDKVPFSETQFAKELEKAWPFK